MIKIKSNKGITIVSLIITVVLIIILSGATISNIDLSNQTEKYNNMVTDIKLINDEILVYYNRYGEIPKTSRTIKIDEVTYYEIDLSKLEEITLNYGDEYGQTTTLKSSSDIYAVDENLNVYYIKGVKKSGETYHMK